MPSNHLVFCHPLLPSVFPSIKVFSNGSVLCIRWSKYWSFSFSMSPPNEYSGLILSRMNWLDPLAVQGTLKSLQHHNSKASIHMCSYVLIWSNSHIHTWLLEKPQLWLDGTLYRILLGQEIYCIWDYIDVYTLLYICPNSCNVQH